MIFGEDLFGDEIRPKVGEVADRFLFPPFTVLDSKTGEWQNRKRAWMASGVGGIESREAAITYQGALNSDFVGSQMADRGGATSAFDPVLTELCYRWFCPPGGQIVDPFCGGAVRGLVARALGREYWGCDLRPEQIASNLAQGEGPVWICGDAKDMVPNAPHADFVFSCPPYGDLEQYSDDPADLSNMDHQRFLEIYRDIIAKCVDKMKRDSFAAFVVGDFRGNDGSLRNFVGETICAFLDAGAKLYNEAVLLTSVGSASLRTRQFISGKKLVKTHQNVLVFCKGSWRAAAAKCDGVAQARRAPEELNHE